MKDRYNLNTLPAGMSEELDYECDNMNQTVVPGLGHEFLPDVSSKFNQDNGEANSMPAIPGLDLPPEKSATPDASMSGLSFADSKMIRRKAIYTKPVPKDFERAWKEGRQPPTIASARENIPDDRTAPDPTAGRPNFDNHGGPPFEIPHSPHKWHGLMRHPNAEGPMNHDQPNALLPNPEPLPPHHPGQRFPMGPPQGPPGGPRGPMQGGPVRGPMSQGPGPRNPMMHRMSNPMQAQQQHGMMPPPRHPPQMNQPMRGPMGPSGPGGPQGPRPLLSLPFQDRDIPPGGGHPGLGTGRGIQSHLLSGGNEDGIRHSHPPGGHFENPSGENVDVYQERSRQEFNVLSRIPDHSNGQFDSYHPGDIDYCDSGFSPNDNAASQMHQEPFPTMGSDPNARGNWRRPRGGPGMHPGPPGNRNFGPPGNEHFVGQNKPPSLLDMKIGPAPSSSMGMKRKWEGPPNDEDPEFMMQPPPSSEDGHPPGPFDINPEMSNEDADNWPPEGPMPPNTGRGRGNFFRGRPPGRGLLRGRVMRGRGRGR